MPNNDYANAGDQSRAERILSSTINGTEYDEPVQSRLEYLLIELKNVIEGGSSDAYATAISLTINSSTYVMTAQLLNKDGDPLGTAQTIDLPLESMVVSGSYDSTTKKVILTLKNGQTVEFSIADLIDGLASQSDLNALGNRVTTNENNISTEQAKTTGMTEGGSNYITVGGIRVYVSATAPTGTIPDGSVGVGW